MTYRRWRTWLNSGDLIVVSDEIYDRLVYDSEHTCFASLPGMRERTVLLGGFSKSYAMTGWRVGYAAAPAEILEAMMKVHQYVTMCAPTMSQAAAVEALHRGSVHVEEMRESYDRRRRVMVKAFNDMGLTCFEPKGAFYAFPSIVSSGLSSEEFAERAADGRAGGGSAWFSLWRLRRRPRAVLLRHFPG